MTGRSARRALVLFLLAALLPVGAHAQSVHDAVDAQAPSGVVDTPMMDAPRVRVRLLDGTTPETVQLQAVEGDLRFTLDGESSPLLRLRPGETATVGVRSGELYVRRDAEGLYATTLHMVPTGEATWRLRYGNSEARSYSGHLYLRPDPEQADVLELVNAAPLEDYVASVVASEYGFEDTEGAKAMAVVARTYALRAAEKFDGAYDHVDHTASQVYGGLSAITPAARRAVEATQREVITHDGQLIEAVYFSSSGGHTANNEDVWDADKIQPYLRGQRDPYDRASPHHRWSTTIDREALLRALSRHYGFRVTGFLLGDRSRDGRLREIELLRANGSKHRVQANAFRLLVNRSLPEADLKSTWFDARRSGDHYEIEGRGFGHGVGLSQWGAHEMAQRGHGYRDILSFYYTGVSIQQRDGTLLPTPPVAQRDQDPQPPTESRRRIGW